MSSDTVDSESIGPQLSLEDVVFPAGISERFRELYGVETELRTAADWMDVTRRELGASLARAPTVEDLCTSEDGAHTFVGEETQSYVCVLDPLAYPFIVGELGTVRSETPVRGAEVRFAFERGGVDVTPGSAVVSIGVSDHVDAVEDVTVETVYRQVCGYIHAFADIEEYETWAADAEAATTPLPADEGVAVAREIAGTLFEGDQ